MDLQTDARIATLKGIESSIKSALQLVKTKAIVKGKEKDDCALLCIGNNCPNGDSMTCDSYMSPISPDDDYILVSYGSLNSNTAMTSLKKIIETDSTLEYNSCGPAGNICITLAGTPNKCCNFLGSNFPTESDACMVHLWLYGQTTVVETLTGGC